LIEPIHDFYVTGNQECWQSGKTLMSIIRFQEHYEKQSQIEYKWATIATNEVNQFQMAYFVVAAKHFFLAKQKSEKNETFKFDQA